MRMCLLAVIAVFSVTVGAVAQTAGSVPSSIGNRANGKDYQPTPSEVVPRETAAGVLPSKAQERAMNQDLGRMDKDLLRSEGLSTKSVPKMTNGQ
jgi:hypothetical protein